MKACLGQGSFALVIWENASTGGYRGAENGTPMQQGSPIAGVDVGGPLEPRRHGWD